MKKQLLFGHLLTLLLGGLIYICFRTNSLIMFRWLAALSLDKSIGYLRETTMTSREHLPDWLMFSLPDGLWVFSYVTLIFLIWGYKINEKNALWVFLIPFTAILFEVGQWFHIVPGTFDAIDLVFYVTGAISPFVIFANNPLNLKQSNHEQ